ncbi:hypothetical protein CDD83_3064 [Cordyceps sp. RAO-2017]|nr:hypothetical protein CDD83_3064 [Cordyceps sp. RAO-2017]
MACSPTRQLLLLLGAALLLSSLVLAEAQSTDGIKGLADRLLKGHGDDFEFVLTTHHERWSRWNPPSNDNYTVRASPGGKIRIEGTTLSALARGLRHYATEALHLDNFWFVDSYQKLPSPLPAPAKALTGASVVPWRYNLNTVTFSYTFVWYSWDDWERMLDWAAWRGVNLQLAWVGYEKVFLDSFRDLGMTDDEILPFLSGPAFQAWNRFGNIKGSWGGLGGLPLAWIEAQAELQRRIVRRMVELGITPVLPAFPGFVPDAIRRVRPGALVTRAPIWAGVPDWSGDYFLSPLDPAYDELQRAFVTKQLEAFGNVTNFYTLDQFNEMAPASGEAAYLSDVSRQTYRGLTAVNPAAVWLMQGWLFVAARDFWSRGRIDAYLGGVEDRQGLVLLDLYAEAEPQWQRTDSFAGRPWIWCQLHDFGGNMNLFGNVSAATDGPVRALAGSGSLVGLGLTPEAYEGNEVVYDILLDQAWSPTPIDTTAYFGDWASRRYGGVSPMPPPLLRAWQLLREHVYDNRDPAVPSAGVGVYQLAPRLSGLVNRTGHFPAPTALHYDGAVLRRVWALMRDAAEREPALWRVPAFRLDLVDVGRQVMGNAFVDVYLDVVRAYHDAMTAGKQAHGRHGASPEVSAKGRALLDFLDGLDLLLSTNEHFTLHRWLRDAQRWADKAPGSRDLFAFNARSQVTVWLWESPVLNDYSARAWAGLTRSYYRRRWSIFVEGLERATETGSLDEAALNARIRAFEKRWQYEGFALEPGPTASLEDAIKRVQRRWPQVFSTD